MEDDRLTSEPPNVKTINAGAQAFHMIVGSLIELAMVTGSFWMLSVGKVSFTELCVLLGISAVGPTVGRLKGKNVPTTATMLIAGALAKGSGHFLLPIILSISALGCADDLRSQADEYRTKLNATSAVIRGAHATADFLCEAYGPQVSLLEKPCKLVGPAALGLDSAWRAAWSAIDAYAAGIATLAAVEATISEMEDTAETFGALVEEVKRVVESNSRVSDPVGVQEDRRQAEPGNEDSTRPPAQPREAPGAASAAAP